MFLQLDPSRLTGQPLLLHQREPGEYWVIVAGFIAGRVSRYQTGDGSSHWLWYLTGPRDRGEGICEWGEGRSLLDAKEALRLSLKQCIDKATQLNASIAWTP